MVVWKSPRLKKSYMGKLERQIEKRELWNISGKPVQCTNFIYLFIYSKGIIQRVKREFLLQNLDYYLKKKKKKAKSEYSGPEYIFTWNGLVFKARQNRGVLVPN
jgi:hypothetical protein